MKKMLIIIFLLMGIILHKNSFTQDNTKLLVENKTDQKLVLDVEISFKCVSTTPKVDCGRSSLVGKKITLDFFLDQKTIIDIKAEAIKKLNISPQKIITEINSFVVAPIYYDKGSSFVGLEQIKIYGSQKLVNPQKEHYEIIVKKNNFNHLDEFIIEEAK